MESDYNLNESEDHFGENEVEIDDSAPTDCSLPFVDFGCSLEDHRTIFHQGHPTNSQWKDIEPPNSYNVYATLDGARQIVWSQARYEIDFVRNKVRAALGSREPTINNLVDLIFGPRSNIGRLLEEKLGISSEDFSKQLATYSLAAAYNLSKTQIFCKNSFVNVEGLTDEKKYSTFWTSIARSGCKEPGNTAHVRGLRPLWLDVQNALNETFRELFIEGFEGYMRITNDDDKMHLATGNKADTQGLKVMQHVRDNRKGFVAHTSCYTASGLPVGIEWERSWDDSTTAATERLIRHQLSPTSGQNGPPMMFNTEIAIDRGYCIPSLLYDFLLPSGCDVIGTVKRSPMFPFTYDQKKGQSDTRQSINPAGFKTLFVKKLTMSNKEITGIAYRDGKGGITLGLTTLSQMRHWDLVLSNPQDAKNSIMGEEKGRWFKRVHYEEDRDITEDYSNMLQQLSIIPLTTKQNTPEWFLLRMFSCTSSTSDNLLNEVKKMALDSNLCMLIDEATAISLETILNVVYGVRWDHNQANSSPSMPSNTRLEQEVEQEVNAPSNSEAGAEHREDITMNVQLLMSGEALKTGLEDRVRSQVMENTMTDDVLKAYLEKIGSKPVKERKKNLEKIKKWLEYEPQKRPYFNMSKAKLIEACISKFGGKKSAYESYNNEELIQRLITYQSDPSYIAQRARNTLPQGSSSTMITLLTQIVKSSFLPKLSAKGKEYSKMGHQLEMPFAKKLLMHSRQGLTKIEVCEIYQVGLVGKLGEPYAKASCDFIAGAVTREGEKILVGVECKARVTAGTHQREREHAEFLSHFQNSTSMTSTSSTGTGSTRGTELYTVIDAASGDFHTHIDSSHEAVQLLHQAYVCNFEYVLLLVGDPSGNIIRGVWVYFDPILLRDYGIMLKYFYEHSLKWAYQAGDNTLPKQEIEFILSNHKSVDMEAFLGYFYLWKYVSTQMPLPIPQLERIVPFTISKWNSIKGGSDTITKFMWLNMYDPPCNSPQSHAIARMLMLGNIVIHRLNHFFTAKENLGQGYPSLKHYRYAANQRYSFHSTLLLIVQAIKNRFLSNASPSPALSLSGTEGVLTRKKDTRTKMVAWGSTTTGATPQRQVKKWYKTIKANPSEILVHTRMKECTGVPVYRVDMKTKSNKGAGSRGHCAECNRLTNVFCIICKKWLCDPQLAANRDTIGIKSAFYDDPKYIKIVFDDGTVSGKEEAICAVFSCWHKSHQAALEENGALERGWHCYGSDNDDISSMSSP